MSEYRKNRTVQIGVRLTEQELEALKREAKRTARTVSEVMRRRGLKGLDVQAIPVGDKQREAVG
jgi:hypothetical protein